MRWIYAVGYALGCHLNYRRYVAEALADDRIGTQLEDWATAA